jgi:hypothetical protein
MCVSRGLFFSSCARVSACARVCVRARACGSVYGGACAGPCVRAHARAFVSVRKTLCGLLFHRQASSRMCLRVCVRVCVARLCVCASEAMWTLWWPGGARRY